MPAERPFHRSTGRRQAQRTPGPDSRFPRTFPQAFYETDFSYQKSNPKPVVAGAGEIAENPEKPLAGQGFSFLRHGENVFQPPEEKRFSPDSRTWGKDALVGRVCPPAISPGWGIGFPRVFVRRFLQGPSPSAPVPGADVRGRHPGSRHQKSPLAGARSGGAGPVERKLRNPSPGPPWRCRLRGRCGSGPRCARSPSSGPSGRCR